MTFRLRRSVNIQILLAGLLVSGCASVQRAMLESDVTNSVPSAQSEPLKAASGDTQSSNAGVDPGAGADQAATASVAVPPERSARPCNRNKAISVGMNVAQVYRSCWGKPKSVNISVMGSTKTEMLLYEGYNYIYVENGIVKSIETSDR